MRIHGTESFGSGNADEIEWRTELLSIAVREFDVVRSLGRRKVRLWIRRYPHIGVQGVRTLSLWILISVCADSVFGVLGLDV